MRQVGFVIALAAFALVAGGCSDGETVTAAPSPSPGDTWSLLVEGSATPSPTPSGPTGSRSPVATASLPSANPSCTQIWPATEPVFIPIVVTAFAGGFGVQWPRQYDSNYRVTAVPQKLVSGAQPEPTWKDVPAGTGCTVSTTLTGLIPGEPYVVWLDAPNTGYETDGTRHPYSGRSGVVYPK